MRLWQRNLLLAVLVVVLAVLPLYFLQGAEWKGADDRSMAAIQQIDKSYQPWFRSIFVPGDLGIERYMFGFQALLGAAATIGTVAWFMGRRRALNGDDGKGDITMARVIALAATVAIVLLFIPQPQSGELKDLISAVQGVCIGFFTFFIGYPLGRKSAEARTA